MGECTIYAPGMLTSLFPLLPMAVWGIVLLRENSFTGLGIAKGIGISVGIAACLILIPFGASIQVKSQEFAFKNIGYFSKYKG